MLKPLKIVNYRKYKKHKNIVVWTKMSTKCTQIKNFVDKKVRVIEKIILTFLQNIIEQFYLIKWRKSHIYDIMFSVNLKRNEMEKVKKYIIDDKKLMEEWDWKKNKKLMMI